MFKTDEVDVTEGEGLVEVCLMSSEKVPSETTVKILLSDCPGEPCDGAANGQCLSVCGVCTVVVVGSEGEGQGGLA